jgi:hypothetical protein
VLVCVCVCACVCVRVRACVRVYVNSRRASGALGPHTYTLPAPVPTC